MKKHVVLSVIVLFALSVTGYVLNNNSHSTGDLTNSSQTISNIEVPTWRTAYAAVLMDFNENNSSDEILRFSLRDMDNDGVPELIIMQSNNNTSTKVLTVYSYYGNAYKVGECDNPESFASALRFSNNPKFPGLFQLWYGGGVERYGYLSVQEGQLVSEKLWNNDHTTENLQQIYISDNKELINESIEAYPPYDYTDNILEMYLINEDNIAEKLEGDY